MPLLLAALLLAQTAIPTALQPEDAVAAPSTFESAGGQRPHIASDGNGFLVVSSTLLPYSTYSVTLISLVDASGEPLLPATYRFGSGASEATVAAGAGEYLVVWSHTGDANAVRVDSSGRLLDEQPIVVHPPTWGDSGIRGIVGTSPVAWNGSEFVVLTKTGSPLTKQTWIATRLDETGTIIQNDIPVTDDAQRALIAADRGVSLILTQHSFSAEARTLTRDVLSPPIPLSSAFDDLSAGDDGFLAVSIAESGLVGQHFDGSGRPDRSPFPIMGGEIVHASVKRSGTAYLVTWASAYGKIAAMRITGSGDRLDMPVVVTNGDWSEAASNGRADLLAFTPDPNGTTHVMPLRADAPARIPYRSYADQFNPIVTWERNEPHVTWNGNGAHEKPIGATTSTDIATDVAIVAVASSGSSKLYVGSGANGLQAWTKDGRRVAIFPTQAIRDVHAVATQESFWIVWTTAAGQIQAARLSMDGVLLETRAAGAGLDVAVGASRDSVLIVSSDGMGVVRGSSITPRGVIDTGDLTIPQDFPRSLSVASDGTDFLVTWINQNAAQSNDYLAGVIVSAGGHVIGPKHTFSDGGDMKTQSTAFWTGSNYLLLWSKTRNYAEKSDLWAVRISREGDLLDYPAVHIGALNGRLSSAAPGPAGQLAVAYTRREGGASGSQRAYSRAILAARRRSVRPLQ